MHMFFGLVMQSHCNSAEQSPNDVARFLGIPTIISALSAFCDNSVRANPLELGGLIGVKFRLTLPLVPGAPAAPTPALTPPALTPAARLTLLTVDSAWR